MDPSRRSRRNKFGDSRALLSFDCFHSAFYICETTTSTRLLGRSIIMECLTSYETRTCAWDGGNGVHSQRHPASEDMRGSRSCTKKSCSFCHGVQR